MPKSKVVKQIAANPGLGEYLKESGVYPKPAAKKKTVTKKKGG